MEVPQQALAAAAPQSADAIADMTEAFSHLMAAKDLFLSFVMSDLTTYILAFNFGAEFTDAIAKQQDQVMEELNQFINLVQSAPTDLIEQAKDLINSILGPIGIKIWEPSKIPSAPLSSWRVIMYPYLSYLQDYLIFLIVKL